MYERILAKDGERVRVYYNQFYAHKFNDLNEKDKFLEIS
jgi:hypothetical protein